MAENHLTGKIKNISAPLIADLSPIQIEVTYEFVLSQTAIGHIKSLNEQPAVGDIVQIKYSDIKKGDYGTHYGRITGNNPFIFIGRKKFMPIKQSHIITFESAKERIKKECKDHPQLILSAIEIKSHEGDVVTIACEDWIIEEKQRALGHELKKAKQIIKEEFKAKELVFQILKETPETIIINK